MISESAISLAKQQIKSQHLISITKLASTNLPVSEQLALIAWHNIVTNTCLDILDMLKMANDIANGTGTE